MKSHAWLIVGSIVSVLGSAYLALFVPQVAPGVLFGALVLAPQVSGPGRRMLRRLALIGLSTATYLGAFWLTLRLINPFGDLGYATAGTLGALAVVAFARPLLPAVLPALRWLEAAIFGLLGGAVLPLTFKALGLSLLGATFVSLIPCFMIWQIGVALALFREPPEKAS